MSEAILIISTTVSLAGLGAILEADKITSSYKVKMEEGRSYVEEELFIPSVKELIKNVDGELNLEEVFAGELVQEAEDDPSILDDPDQVDIANALPDFEEVVDDANLHIGIGDAEDVQKHVKTMNNLFESYHSLSKHVVHIGAFFAVFGGVGVVSYFVDIQSPILEITAAVLILGMVLTIASLYHGVKKRNRIKKYERKADKEGMY